MLARQAPLETRLCRSWLKREGIKVRPSSSPSYAGGRQSTSLSLVSGAHQDITDDLRSQAVKDNVSSPPIARPRVQWLASRSFGRQGVCEGRVGRGKPRLEARREQPLAPAQQDPTSTSPGRLSFGARELFPLCAAFRCKAFPGISLRIAPFFVERTRDEQGGIKERKTWL